MGRQMKMTVEAKIADLERRILELEAKEKNRSYKTTTTKRVFRASVPTEGHRTSEPLTSSQEGSLKKMWSHFDEMFSELGKVFKS
jgi:hypothetical protein